jgi:hypothetical protein
MAQWIFNRFQEASLACFVTPDAALWLETPIPRIPARDKASRLQLVQAIYETLLACGIGYVLEPYGEAPGEQEVRPPGQILRPPKQGTCLDLALLFCGLCQATELLPVMILLDGHALAAVCLESGWRQWGGLDRPDWNKWEKGPMKGPETWLPGRIKAGAYVAVECTGFAAPGRILYDPTKPEGQGRSKDGLMDFPRAVAAANEQLDFARSGRKFQYCLDIAVARFHMGIGSDNTGAIGAPRKDPGILPYLVDRTEQVEAVRAILSEPPADPAAAPAAMGPTIFVLAGDDVQAHAYFVKRLLDHDLRDFPGAGGRADPFAPDGFVNLPRPGDNPPGIRLRREVAPKVGMPAWPSPPAWDSLAAAIDSDPRRFLFVHQYDTDDWAKDRGERVTRALEEWAACRVLRPERRPIVLFNFIYRRRIPGKLAGALRALGFWDDPNGPFAAFVAGLERTHPAGTRLVPLPTLPGVTEGEVDAWLARYAQRFCNDSPLLGQVKAIFGNDGEIPMIRLVPELDDLLRSCS